jgi:hypothetical protein
VFVGGGSSGKTKQSKGWEIEYGNWENSFLFVRLAALLCSGGGKRKQAQ